VNLKLRYDLGDTDIGERITLKWIFKKLDVWVQTRLIWPRIATTSRLS